MLKHAVPGGRSPPFGRGAPRVQIRETASGSAKRAEIVLDGDVQNVGVRVLAEMYAGDLGLVGLVRHTKDGGAEVVCEGRKDSIDGLVGKLRGCLRLADANVASVSYLEPRGAFGSFSAVYDGDERRREEILDLAWAGVWRLKMMSGELRDVKKVLRGAGDRPDAAGEAPREGSRRFRA